MDSIVIQADLLNLPDKFANKLYGKMIELIESGDSIIISPVKQKQNKKEAIEALLRFASQNRIIDSDFVFNRDECYDE